MISKEKAKLSSPLFAVMRRNAKRLPTWARIFYALYCITILIINFQLIDVVGQDHDQNMTYKLSLFILAILFLAKLIIDQINHRTNLSFMDKTLAILFFLPVCYIQATLPLEKDNEKGASSKKVNKVVIKDLKIEDKKISDNEPLVVDYYKDYGPYTPPKKKPFLPQGKRTNPRQVRSR